jgi:hypothetical protein
MEPRREVDLAAELRALRPAPRPAFAAELDERAAAGFPRRSSAGSPAADFAFCSPRVRKKAKSTMGRLVARARTVEPRRMLLPAGATAFTAIVVATAAIIASEGGQTATGKLARVTPAIAPQAVPSAGAGGTPVQNARSGESSAIQYAESPSASSAEGRAVAPPAMESSGPGPYASHVAHRDVERSARIVLGDDASHVRGDAAKVFEAVQAYDGIVLRSSIRDGSGGEAGATFDLLIPTGRLADAMAAFSEIAEVRSRGESTADVTAPIVGLGERLQDARAKVESLLTQLSGAETEAERQVAEAKLRSARRHVTALRARLASLQRRTHLSEVTLRIATGGGAGHSGGWGIGTAFHDAGRILAIAAGVTLVGLAVLVPLALLFLLAGLAQRSWARRSRERALG